MRGPLKLLKENWLDKGLPINLLDKTFILMVDASDIGVGAGRSQKFRASYYVFLTQVQ